MTEQQATGTHSVAPGGDGSGASRVERADGDGRSRSVPRWLETAAALSWRTLLVVAVVALVVWTLAHLALVVIPLIVALILATLCTPVSDALQRRGMRPGLAAAIAVGGGLATLAGVIAALAPTFADQLGELTPTLQAAADAVLGWLETGPLAWDAADVDRLVRQFTSQAQASSGRIVSGVVSGALILAEVVTAILLMLVVLFFLVKDGPTIVDWFVARTPARHRDVARALGRRAWHALGGYVRGTATIALIDAVGIGLGLLVLRVPLVLPLTVLVFLGAFLPVIGAFISGLVAVLVALATGGLTRALLVLAVVVAVQQLESHVLQPVIMRRAVALHPVIILLALGVGAVIAGIAGAFLAVPVTAVIAAVGNELRLRAEAAPQ